MKSMKLPARKKTHPSTAVALDDDRQYPWGLTITLEKDALKALGMKPEGFDPKQTYHLRAKAFCETVSVEKGRKEESGSVRLQITHLDVADEGTEEDRATKEAFKL